jgi:hypothetical protein
MFRNGRYEDLLIYVLTRAGAEEASRRLLRRPGTAAPASPAAPVPAVLPASAEVGRDT